MSVETSSLRNVAIAGHGGTGKTTIFEHFLAISGSIDKAEPVSSGKSVSDFTDEEIERKTSIHLALGFANTQDTTINILDTPGASDFVGEVVAAFRMCDSALVVVGAKEGVQIETVKLWRRLEARAKPRMVFINKLDSNAAGFDEPLADLRQKFKSTFVPVVVPIASPEGFLGVVDIINQQAYFIPSEGETEKAVDVPEDMADLVEIYRSALIEAAAEGADDLLEKYLEEETLTDEELSQGLRAAVGSGKIVPVLCGAAEIGSGVRAALDFIAESMPSPLGSSEPIADSDETVTLSESGEPIGFAFKTTIDQFAGKLSFTKVISGVIAPDSDLINPRTRSKQRIGKIYRALGKQLVELESLVAGDIGVLVKLEAMHNFDTICSSDNLIQIDPVEIPQPVHSVAVSAESKKDEDKMNQLLQRAAEEDPTFTIRFNPETKQTVISGMGELHINIILDRIRDKQKVAVETRVPKVPYRETITKPSDGEYTHKKQTGGHGQYGRVVLKIRPLERGEKYSFENIIKGGSISRGYIPGVEKGIQEAMESGNLAGYPVVDLAATITDGKEHPVDSSEMAFRLAAKGALLQAMETAGSVLLEPVVNLKVFTNDDHVGDILSDLSSRRGRVSGQDALGGGITEIDAQVPQAELLRYSIDLRSITSGTASFEMEFSHYSQISGKHAEDVIKAAKAAAVAD